MVSRRTSVALMATVLIVALLLRSLLEVERPARAPGASRPEAPRAPDDRPAELLDAPALPSVPEARASERQSLPTGSAPAATVEPRTEARSSARETGSVLVSVLDAHGRPAPGVPVGLSTHLDDPDPSEERSSPALERVRWFPGDQGVTDANGSVELHYFAPTALELAHFRTLLAPQLAFEELPTLETRPGELPPPVVVLRLPPTGSVRVRVEPVELVAEADASVEAVIDGHLRRNVPVTDGEALFAFVELGREIELRLLTAALANRPGKVVVRGPEIPGEVVEAKLVVAAWPTLRFRVCDEAGQPLANAAFSVRIHHGRLSPQPGNARTDENGETEFVVYGNARNEDARELLLWSTSPPRLAQVWLPEVLATPTELGNVTLRRVSPASVPPP